MFGVFPGSPETCFIKNIICKNDKMLDDPTIIQGIVDGSASKPVLRQDTGCMVEKTYHDIAPYLGAFGTYLMPH